MRRTDKEITDRTWIDTVISEARYLTLSLATPDGKPYAVVLSHVYDGENFYFHCAKKGLKLDIIKANSKAAFSLVSFAEYYENPQTRSYTMHYKSVAGFGNTEFVTDFDEKEKALMMIKEKFIRTPYEITENIVNSVCIIKLRIDEIYGKCSQ